MNKEERYNAVRETLDEEVRLFWSRSLFFWGFIASAFLTYSWLYRNPKEVEDLIFILVASFGMISSLCWTLTNRGNMYWFVKWKKELLRLEDNSKTELTRVVDRPDDVSFWNVWCFRRRVVQYSVTKLSIAMSDFIFVVWLFIFGHELTNRLPDVGFMRLRIDFKLFLIMISAFIIGIIIFTASIKLVKEENYKEIINRKKKK